MSYSKKKSCQNCGKELLRNESKYCSNVCQITFQYKEYIDRWKNDEESGMCGEYGISKHIVRYLREKYENKCCRCGWSKVNPFTNKIPLEVEHIDGNYLNNDEDNLALLCPNCHSLTSTYKGANIGNGRKARHKYYEEK